MSEQLKKTYVNDYGVTMSLVNDTESNEWLVKAESPDAGTFLSLPSCWDAMKRVAHTFDITCDFYDDYAYFAGFQNHGHAMRAFRHLATCIRLHKGGAA